MDETIKISEEFVLPRDLSAMAKTFFVQTEKPLQRKAGWFIKKGSTVTGVVQRLIEMFPLPNGTLTKVQDWYKCRGTAIITDGKEEQIKEIHWYQCENIGKVEFKTKERGDEDADKVQR